MSLCINGCHSLDVYQIHFPNTYTWVSSKGSYSSKGHSTCAQTGFSCNEAGRRDQGRQSRLTLLLSLVKWSTWTRLDGIAVLCFNMGRWTSKLWRFSVGLLCGYLLAVSVIRQKSKRLHNLAKRQGKLCHLINLSLLHPGLLSMQRDPWAEK